MHVLILSKDLIHSGEHTQKFLFECIDHARVKEVLSKLHTLHVWSDNASNLSNKVVATSVLILFLRVLRI